MDHTTTFSRLAAMYDRMDSDPVEPAGAQVSASRRLGMLLLALLAVAAMPLYWTSTAFGDGSDEPVAPQSGKSAVSADDDSDDDSDDDDTTTDGTGRSDGAGDTNGTDGAGDTRGTLGTDRGDQTKAASATDGADDTRGTDGTGDTRGTVATDRGDQTTAG